MASMAKEYEMLFRLRGSLGSDFTKSFSGAQKQINSLSSEYAHFKKAAADVQGFKKAAEEYGRLVKKADALEKEMNESGKSTAKQAKELEALRKSAESARSEMEKYAKRMKSAGVETDKADEALEKYNAELDKLDKKSAKIDKITKRWNSQSDAITNTSANLMTVARTYGNVMGAAYNYFISPSSALEQSMANVKAYYGANDSDVARLKAVARQTGLTTKYTSVESASAFEEMGKAGWSVDQSISGLGGIISLASASDESLASITGTIVNYLNAFGLDSSQSDYFSDLLAASAMATTADVSDFSESLKYSAATANSLGFSLADTMLMHSLQAQSGIKGSMAGTQLRRIMTAFAGGNIKYEDGNGNILFDISTTDASGNMRSLRDIAYELRKGFGGLSEDDKASLLAASDLKSIAAEYGIDDYTDMSEDELYDALNARTRELSESEQAIAAESIAMKTGMASLLTIVNTSDEEFERLAYAIDNCSGSAEEMSKIKLDSLQGDIALFNSAVDETAVTIGDEFLPDIRELVKHGTELVGVSAEWIQKNSDTVRSLGKIVAASGPVIASILSLKLAWHGGVKAVTGIQALFSGIVSGSGKLKLAAAAVALIGSAVYAAHVKIKKSNLADMFGDIALSASDVEKAVHAIAYSDDFERAAGAFEAFGGLGSAAEEIKSYKDAISKDNWLLGIGYEFGESDADAYKANVDGMVSSVKQYIKDRGYAYSLGLKAVFGEDYEIDGDMTSSLLTEVSSLGSELSEVLNTAFSDGIFDLDEQKIVSRLQGELNDITSIITNSKESAKWTSLGLEYGGSKLNADSYKELVSKMDEYIDDNVSMAKSMYSDSIASAEVEYNLALRGVENAPDFASRKAAEKKVLEAEKRLNDLKSSGYTKMIGEAYLTSARYQQSTLSEVMGDSLGEDFFNLGGEYLREMQSGDEAKAIEAYNKVYWSLNSGQKDTLKYFRDNIGGNIDSYKELLGYYTESGNTSGASEIQNLLGLYYLMNSQRALGIGMLYDGITGASDNELNEILELSDGNIYTEQGVNMNYSPTITVGESVISEEELEGVAVMTTEKIKEIIEKNTRESKRDALRRTMREPVLVR